MPEILNPPIPPGSLGTMSTSVWARPTEITGGVPLEPGVTYRCKPIRSPGGVHLKVEMSQRFQEFLNPHLIQGPRVRVNQAPAPALYLEGDAIDLPLPNYGQAYKHSDPLLHMCFRPRDMLVTVPRTSSQLQQLMIELDRIIKELWREFLCDQEFELVLRERVR